MLSGLKQKVSFLLKRNPIIAKRPANWRDYVPAPYQGTIIISADFELAWAWRYAKGMEDPIKSAEQYAKRARTNIPVLLKLCEAYEIPITWGTVGHLFLDHCDRDENGDCHKELSRLPYFENDWWKFSSGDWFDHDPCSSLEENNAWYGTDLIQAILDSPIEHEFGSHTFSHIDCTDQVCPKQVMEDELNACQKAADNFDVTLKSFIFPGHTMGNFEAIKNAGYTNVRTNYINEIGYPSLDEYGLWRLPATAEIIMNPKFSKEYNLYRYRKIIDRTLANNAVTNLWFHPSLPCETVQPLFEHIFNYIQQYRNQLQVVTMGDYVDWLKTTH